MFTLPSIYNFSLLSCYKSTRVLSTSQSNPYDSFPILLRWLLVDSCQFLPIISGKTGSRSRESKERYAIRTNPTLAVIGNIIRSHRSVRWSRTEIAISESAGDNRGINWRNQSERDRHTCARIKCNTSRRCSDVRLSKLIHRFQTNPRNWYRIKYKSARIYLTRETSRRQLYRIARYSDIDDSLLLPLSWVSPLSESDKGLGIIDLHVFGDEVHIDREHFQALSGSRWCSGSAENKQGSKKEDVDHFSSDRLVIVDLGRRNLSLLGWAHTMPSRPADNYIVQWKITGLNILHVGTKMPGGVTRGLSNIGDVLYIYVNVSFASFAHLTW